MLPFDPIWLLLPAGLVLVYGRRIYSWWTTRKQASATDLLVVEHEAMLALKARAERRDCEKLAAAVESVKECFMNGEEPAAK